MQVSLSTIRGQQGELDKEGLHGYNIVYDRFLLYIFFGKHVGYYRELLLSEDTAIRMGDYHERYTFGGGV